MQGRGSSYLPLYIGHPEIGVDKTRRGKNSNRAEKVKREADTIRTEQHLPKKGRRKIEVRKRMLAVLLSVVMVLGMLPVTASAVEGDDSVYLALGDSITTGYAPPLADGTPQKVESPFADRVAAAQGYTLENMAADGETSASLLEKLQETNSDELAAVTSADLITITIGGNDLMGALYAYLAEEYVEENPDEQPDFDADDAKALLMSGDLEFLTFAVGKISGTGNNGFIGVIITTLGTFSTNLQEIIDEIKSTNSQATILVATQYNPYYYLAKSTEGTSFADAASKISTAFETGLTSLNGAISSGASAGYQVVDVHQTFKDAVDSTPTVNPCNASMSTLDFHPNQIGHNLIADAINNKLPEKTYSLSVGGTTITSQNANDVLGDGTVRYDAATKILTLDNAKIDGTQSQTPVLRADNLELKVILIGENKITSTTKRPVYFNSGDYTIQGTENDSLIIETDSDGLQVDNGNLTIDGCNIDITSSSFGGMLCFGAGKGILTIRNGANISIDSFENTLVGKNGLFITDSTVTATANGGAANAIYGGGTISVDNSEVEATTTVQSNEYPAFQADGNIDAEHSAVTVKSAGTIGMWSSGGEVVIQDSIAYVAAHDEWDAIRGQNGGVTINSSWVETFGSMVSPLFEYPDSVIFLNNEGEAKGSLVLPGDVTVGEDMQLSIPEGASITVPDGITLTNNGALDVKGTLEISSTAKLSGSADVSGKVYILETDDGSNPAEGAAFTLSSSGEVYAQLTALSGTTIQPAYRTSGSYSYTTVNGTEESFANRWSYYRGSSSSGTTTYTSTAETVENGTVTISPKNASKGTEVTVTVTPDEGYVLESLTVTDKNGTEIELTDQGDGKYSFTMPASNVKIDAVFTEEEPVGTLPFSDVASEDWFCDAVQYVFDNGMMNGVGNGLFAPDSNLTRGMIAQVLYNLEGTPEAGSDAFTDVEAGQWYADAVNWAAANNIVSGYGDSTFGPQKDITREQMAQILYNYAVFKGYDVSAQGDLSAFGDGSETSDWALPAMKWAVGSGLLQGYAGRLNPAGTATRAEVAQILMNFCENIVMK